MRSSKTSATAKRRALVTLYVPESALDREENGCVLYIHGGSWQGGEKEDMAPHCKKLAMKGYITATMSYSLCSNDTFGEVTRTMLDEISQCIAAIKAYSDRNGLNVTKLATSGYSAGGHISMLYSYARPDGEWDIQRVDLGIALCHFALAVEESGKTASFSLADPGLTAPANTVYIATYQLK